MKICLLSRIVPWPQNTVSWFLGFEAPTARQTRHLRLAIFIKSERSRLQWYIINICHNIKYQNHNPIWVPHTLYTFFELSKFFSSSCSPWISFNVAIIHIQGLCAVILSLLESKEQNWNTKLYHLSRTWKTKERLILKLNTTMSRTFSFFFLVISIHKTATRNVVTLWSKKFCQHLVQIF